MYIDKVTLKNIRGFENLEFSLCRGDGKYAGWTVFTGDNGSGKSTLLKAIAVALTGKETARALQPSFHRWIRDGEHEASIELQIVRTADDDSLSGEGKAPSKEFPACISLKNGGKEPRVEVTIPVGKPRNSRRATAPARSSPWPRAARRTKAPCRSTRTPRSWPRR